MHERGKKTVSLWISLIPVSTHSTINRHYLIIKIPILTKKLSANIRRCSLSGVKSHSVSHGPFKVAKLDKRTDKVEKLVSNTALKEEINSRINRLAIDNNMAVKR